MRVSVSGFVVCGLCCLMVYRVKGLVSQFIISMLGFRIHGLWFECHGLDEGIESQGPWFKVSALGS